jgi:FixJ family two-component response regulator
MPAKEDLRRTVCVVDDDETIREVLATVFGAEGFGVSVFESGEDFLASSFDVPPACVLLDVLMPGKSGLEVLKEFNGRSAGAPVIMISGSADIPMAVDAIRHGALDFIEKPFDPFAIVGRVREALAASGARAAAGVQSRSADEVAGAETLTPREREVLVLIAAGQSNKEAGRELGISPRTIEVHRARIMEKLGAKNAADLVRIVMSASDPR